MGSEVCDETIVDGSPDVGEVRTRGDTLVYHFSIDMTDIFIGTAVMLDVISLEGNKESEVKRFTSTC
jgi:hypothetical protein